MTDIPSNVKSFMEQCANLVASNHRDLFLYDTEPALVICESPIEQLFLTAFRTLVEINEYEGTEELIDDEYLCNGIFVFPQKQIGKYRTDFAMLFLKDGKVPITWRKGTIKKDDAKEIKRLVVELDGHEFHDKDEKQRRYEKARDRHLQKLGYKVFRYTGSEICQNPFKAAAECIAYLANDDEQELLASIEAV